MPESTINRRDFLTIVAAFSAGALTNSALGGTVYPKSPSETAPIFPPEATPEINNISLNTEINNRLLGLIEATPQLDYTPATDSQRPVLSLPEEIEVQSFETAQEYIDNLLNTLYQVQLIVYYNQTNPHINPSFHEQPWYRLAPEYPILQTPNLFFALEQFSKDIQEGRVVLGRNTHPDFHGFAGVYHTFNTDPKGETSVDKTYIVFSYDQLESIKYPSLNDGLPWQNLTNINLLVVAFYEYSSRLHAQGYLNWLKKVGMMNISPNPIDRTSAEVQLITQHNENLLSVVSQIQREHDFPQNGYQNFMQYALHRSIAAIAGNPKAKVIGLERNESLPQYKYFIAANQYGDQSAMMSLMRLLHQGAY